MGFIFCCIYIGLNFTSFAYANDYKRNILKNGTIMNQSGEVFLKFNNNFVYISKINNGQNSAQNIKIFNINDLNLSSFVSAKNAHLKVKVGFCEMVILHYYLKIMNLLMMV